MSHKWSENEGHKGHLQSFFLPFGENLVKIGQKNTWSPRKLTRIAWQSPACSPPGFAVYTPAESVNVGGCPVTADHLRRWRHRLTLIQHCSRTLATHDSWINAINKMFVHIYAPRPTQPPTLHRIENKYRQECIMLCGWALRAHFAPLICEQCCGWHISTNISFFP